MCLPLIRQFLDTSKGSKMDLVKFQDQCGKFSYKTFFMLNLSGAMLSGIKR